MVDPVRHAGHLPACRSVSGAGPAPRQPPTSAVDSNLSPRAYAGVVGHGHAHGRAVDRARLRLVLAITLGVLLVELVGAWMAGSLALLADAGHMATDALAVVVALAASYVASRRAGPRSTFGLHRAEILAVVANGLVLLGVCAALVYAGFERLQDPTEVHATPLIGFALVGLAANAVSLLVLQRSDTGSMNLRAAATEVFADLLGSVLALAAGVVIATTGWLRADPIASLLIAALILPRAMVLLRDAAVVLLELSPPGLDLGAVQRELMAVDGVTEVHDLHAWTITSGLPSLSAHVTVTDACLAQRGVGPVLDELCARMSDRFGIDHATFQVEPATHRSHEDLGELH